MRGPEPVISLVLREVRGGGQNEAQDDQEGNKPQRKPHTGIRRYAARTQLNP